VKKRWPRRGLIFAALAVAFLAIQVEDWGRDLTEHEARIAGSAADPGLRPLQLDRPVDEVVLAVRMAARRMPDWQYVGEARDGAITTLVFERRGRLIRVTDDIEIQIEERGGWRVVSGESRSRLALGDLGRNPRNLRRLLQELRAVIRGSRPPRTSDATTSNGH
jgi:uncharacterized protein (DUF1499 family)